MSAVRENVRRACVDPGARRRVLLLAAAGVSVCIGILAALGSVHGADAAIDVNGFKSEGSLRFFNTDGEANAPTIFSGLLLFGAAFLAASLARSGLAGTRTWWAMAAFLTFMGLDEGMTIHEHVGYWLGVTWQAAYVPVAIIGIVVWRAVLRRLGPHGSARALWLAGAVVWFLALALERVQSDMVQGDPGIRQLALSEETLEMIGSSLFGLALLRVALEVGSLADSATRRTSERPGDESRGTRAEAPPEARVASGER